MHKYLVLGHHGGVMGAAAYHRGNVVIRRQCGEGAEVARERESMSRALDVAEQCNAFVRDAMSYLAAPRGLRQSTVERARLRRGWRRRELAVIDAHNAWVDVDSRNLVIYYDACLRRARSVYELLVFALGMWTIPDSIVVPRVVVRP